MSSLLSRLCLRTDTLFREDDDAQTVSRALDCVGSLAAMIGPEFMSSYLVRIFRGLGTVMTNTAVCFGSETSPEPSNEDVQDLYSAAAHCLISFARYALSSCEPNY